MTERRVTGLAYWEAQPSWSPRDANPQRPDGRYGKEWTCFYVDERQDKINACGSGPNELFTLRYGARLADLRTRLADYLRYENERGRHPIIRFPAGLEGEGLVRDALSTTPVSGVRATDPEWVVHSTSLVAWEAIREDGEVRGSSFLSQAFAKAGELAVTLLGEPPDYAEYVVLGDIESVSPELVVASHGRGAFVSDPDLPYEPGVRLYFDNHAIITSGKAVRDGAHLIKVHRSLPLEPSLIAAITATDCAPKGGARWTPNSFLTAANEQFRSKGQMI